MQTLLRSGISLLVTISVASSLAFASPEAPTKKELRRAKTLKIVTEIGRGIGVGSAVLTLGTARGFGAVTGFFSGLIKKRTPESEQIDRLLTFMMKKEQRVRLDGAVKTTAILEDMNTEIIAEMVDILQEKLDRVSLQILKQIDPKFKDADSLENVDWLSVDFSLLTVDLLTNNKDYQELKSLSGDFDDGQFIRLYRNSYQGVPKLENMKRPHSYTTVDDSLDSQMSEAYGALNVEGVSSILIDTLVPTAIMAASFAPLAAAYSIPMSIGIVGTGISWWQCMKPKSLMRIEMVDEGPDSYEADGQYEKDVGLKHFCTQVVTHPYFKFIVTRTQGYLAGRKAKIWFQKEFKIKKPIKPDPLQEETQGAASSPEPQVVP